MRRGRLDKSESQDPGGGRVGGSMVAALEVQNVRRAIHRYGTLPKGAWIGAYLESLRKSGLSPPGVDSTDDGGGGMRSASPSGAEGLPMTRSSSTQSGFQQPQSPLPPRSGHKPPVPRGASKREASLADLEFPPPPTDLPPPPDDFGEESGEKPPSLDFPPPPGVSPEPRRKPRPSPSPRGRRKDVPTKQGEYWSFNVTRARLRDGGESRPQRTDNRDQSSDSCDSIRSDTGSSGARKGGSGRGSSSGPAKSPGSSSLDTDRQTPPSPPGGSVEGASMASHDGSLDDPPLPPPPGIINGQEEITKPPSPTAPAVQLVSELFESLKQKGPSTEEPIIYRSPNLGHHENHVDFKSNLKKVSSTPDRHETEEDNSKLYVKPKLRKTDRLKALEDNVIPSEVDAHNTLVDFRLQLRKTNVDLGDKKIKTEKDSVNDEMMGKSPRDKSVGEQNKLNSSNLPNSNFKDKVSKEENATKDEDVKNGSADDASSSRATDDSLNVEDDDDDPKRFSSSSISSLKKLWEKQQEEEKSNSQQNSTSPKYGTVPRKKSDVRGRDVEKRDEFLKFRAGDKENETKATKKTPEEETKTNKAEKRVWPPVTTPSDSTDHEVGARRHDGKPTVPAKPVVKNFRPPPPPGGVKLPPPKPAGIYATPSFGKPPAAPVALVKREPEESDDKKEGKAVPSKTKEILPSGDANNKNSKTEVGKKTTIVEEGKEIEELLKNMKKDSSTTTTTSCLNLAQRLEKFRNRCDEYADDIPPQSRFHMKELLSQLESHTWQLRSSGAKSLLNCDPLLSTLKDVACVIKR